MSSGRQDHLVSCSRVEESGRPKQSPQRLKMDPALDDHAVARRSTDCAQNREGRARGYSTRARDDDDGDRRADVAGDQPRPAGGRQREIDQIAGQSISGLLNGRLAVRRAFDCVDDAAKLVSRRRTGCRVRLSG